MGTICIASSQNPNAGDAVTELASQLGDQHYALVAFFCGDRYDFQRLSQKLRQLIALPTALIGCTSAGEIGLYGYQNQSLVAIGLPADDFSVATEVLPNLTEFQIADCQRRIAATLQQSIQQSGARGFDQSLAFLLIDGLSMREEVVGRTVQLTLGAIPLIGGSAGDSLQFNQTLVFHDGQVLSNAAVLAIISTRLQFKILKIQHFERTATRMVVTAATPQKRIVSEINGCPAAIEYARIVGIPTNQLTPLAFAAYPVLVRIGGHEYVRSIQKVNPDHSLRFYCAIDEGIVLSRAQGIDAIASLQHALAAAATEIGPIQAVLACDCILRNLEFRQHGQFETISKILIEHHVAGFSSFGEMHLGVHINQTFTGVAFGLPENLTGSPQP